MSGGEENVSIRVSSDIAGSSRASIRRGGKSPGPEWQFATNMGRYVEWKCNICGEEKSGGAPRIRDHFIGGNGRACGGKCKGPGADEANTRLKTLLGKMIGNK